MIKVERSHAPKQQDGSKTPEIMLNGRIQRRATSLEMLKGSAESAQTLPRLEKIANGSGVDEYVQVTEEYL